MKPEMNMKHGNIYTIAVNYLIKMKKESILLLKEMVQIYKSTYQMSLPIQN